MTRAYIVTDSLGIVALDENGNVVGKVLFDLSNPDIVADKLIELEKMNIVDEIVHIIENLRNRGFKSFVIEGDELARKLAMKFPDLEIVSIAPNPVSTRYRAEFWERYLGEVFGVAVDEYYSRLFELTDLVTRKKLRQVAEKRDLFIAQAISALDDVDRIMNLIASRIREWYGLHFPELEELVRDNREYVRLVYHLGHRSNFTVENISKLDIAEERARRIADAARKSVGAEMAEWDLDQIRTYAKIFLDLLNYRQQLATYIDEAMREVAPNIRELVGPLLGARLIKLAGGLMRLAILPASTIQVLGAEKALFRALRTGGKPPKHGVIFQFPEIFRSPRWQRGKIARALAAKLAIAAKADAFTGNFIAPKLREELMARIQEIKTLYAKPPPKTPAKPTAPAPAQRSAQPRSSQHKSPSKGATKKPSKK